EVGTGCVECRARRQVARGTSEAYRSRRCGSGRQGAGEADRSNRQKALSYCSHDHPPVSLEFVFNTAEITQSQMKVTSKVLLTIKSHAKCSCVQPQEYKKHLTIIINGITDFGADRGDRPDARATGGSRRKLRAVLSKRKRRPKAPLIAFFAPCRKVGVLCPLPAPGHPR